MYRDNTGSFLSFGAFLILNDSPQPYDHFKNDKKSLTQRKEKSKEINVAKDICTSTCSSQTTTV